MHPFYPLPMFTLCCQTIPRVLFLVRKAFRLVLRWVSLKMRPNTGGHRSEPYSDIINGYQDLLKTLRSVGDLRWTFATHGPSQNPANISPRAINDGVLRSSRITEVISRLAAEESPQTEAELAAKVRAILAEMGHSYSIWYIRLLGFILIKATRRMYEHIWVNVGLVRELEPLFSNHDVPVIFMPTHRSYADFLIVSFVAFHYGLPVPTIASGIDFLGMRVVGEILRRAGAFFIRRSFADDPLYRAVFAEYVQSILRHPQPLEFFVEGTRSRSGKSLYPKFGLLQAATEVYLRGSVSDILIVPISITYERTLEEYLYARELLGVPKPPESTSALFKACGVLQDNYGSMWFHFGSPISVRDYMEGKVDRSIHNLVPRDHHSAASIQPTEVAAVKSLAFSVIQEQQKHIKIHDWAILATVLLHRLRQGETKTPVDMALAGCDALSAVISADQDSKTSVTLHTIQHCVTIHRHVVRLNSEKNLLEITPEAMKDSKMVHILLAHYRNHILHRVISRALRVVSRRQTQLTDQDASQFLSQIFAWEFVSHTTDGNSGDSEQNDTSNRPLLEMIIEPFLVGYAFILRILLSQTFLTPAHVKTARTLSKALQKVLDKLVTGGAYPAMEILSLDLIANCIQALKNIGAVQVEPDLSLVVIRPVLADLSLRLDLFVPVGVLVSLTSAMDSLFYNNVLIHTII